MKAQVRFADGGQRTVDHLLLGTGYRVDIARYSFLAPALARIRRAGGYPVLSRGMESSVPGLHFVGAPAAWSFGPIMRFVSGSWYTGRALVRTMAGPPAAGVPAAPTESATNAVTTSTRGPRAGYCRPGHQDWAQWSSAGQPGPGDCPEPGTPGVPVCVIDDETSISRASRSSSMSFVSPTCAPNIVLDALALVRTG